MPRTRGIQNSKISPGKPAFRTKAQREAYFKAYATMHAGVLGSPTPEEEKLATGNLGGSGGKRTRLPKDEKALDELMPLPDPRPVEVLRRTFAEDEYRDHPPCPAGLPRTSEIPEWREQANLVEWMKLTLPHTRNHIVMIGNEGAKTAAQHNVAQMMGRRLGASDLFISRPSMGFHGLYIEMKEARMYSASERSTKTFKNQIEFIADQKAVGYDAHFVFGRDHGIEIVRQYFGMLPDVKK